MELTDDDDEPDVAAGRGGVITSPER